jgi:hypothetical protein
LLDLPRPRDVEQTPISQLDEFDDLLKAFSERKTLGDGITVHDLVEDGRRF